MKTLLIDNYDSFTYNLYQLIAEVNKVEPLVVKNDVADWDQIKRLDFDNIVISPGPGRPENESDFGICQRAIQEATVPVLGICLGHQGICHLFGGHVDYAKTVMHGRISHIHHNSQCLFEGIPSPFPAVRYHSLYVKDLPVDMQKLAWTEEGMIMAASHRTKPIWSVQFHPESIKTQFGYQLLENFKKMTESYKPQGPRPCYKPLPAALKEQILRRIDDHYIYPLPGTLNGREFDVYFRRLALDLDAEDVFMQNFSKSQRSYWLDSALVRGFSRFSYMGDCSGPHAEYITYNMPNKEVKVDSGSGVATFSESIFDFLDRMIKERSVQTEGLPFDFNLGYVGYLGYELKGDCGYEAPYASNVPDATFIFSDRAIVFDHEEKSVYLLCLDDKEHASRAHEWLEQMAVKLHNVPKSEAWVKSSKKANVTQTFRHSPDDYIERIKQSQVKIKQGETYEVCLTNMITHDVVIDPLNTYRALRHTNPAPYATYLQFDEASVLCSSPERFITVDANGRVESKPIKGTRKRGKDDVEDEKLYEDLRTNEKDHSENLMIVDLLRNDIGQTCTVGSVHVSNIFAVESYATVHQLVSTVRGQLKRECSVIDCVRSCFPGGSMTGAPKKRTMEIIDDLEGGARGIYSGSIGFFSLNGSADLSIVIRTIVMAGGDVTVGVGGAIIDLSNPQEELEEMVLKSKALTRALSESQISRVRQER